MYMLQELAFNEDCIYKVTPVVSQLLHTWEHTFWQQLTSTNGDQLGY